MFQACRVQRKALFKGTWKGVQDGTLNGNHREKSAQTGKFRLCIDGMPILEWFKMKLQELKEKLGASCAPKEIKGVKRD